MQKDLYIDRKTNRQTVSEIQNRKKEKKEENDKQTDIQSDRDRVNVRRKGQTVRLTEKAGGFQGKALVLLSVRVCYKLS